MGPQKRAAAPTPHERMLPHAFLSSQERNVPKKMTPAQERALATIMGRRVIADAGLPAPGRAAFADQVPGKPAAKDSYIPGMTARTAVARGINQRTKQHGLLTPEQQDAEVKSTLAAAKAPTFLETHDLTRTPLGDLTPPPMPHLTPQQIINMLGVGPRGRAGALVPNTPGRPPPPPPPAPIVHTPPVSRGTGSPREQLQAAQPHQGNFFDAASEWLQGPAIGKPGAAWLGRNVLAPTYRALDTGTGVAERGVPIALGEAFNPGALRVKGGQGGLSAGDNPASKLEPISQGALADHIRMGSLKTPKVNINVEDITGLLGGTPAGATTGQTATIPFDELAGHTGWGLTDEARKRGTAIILKNGWTKAQLEAMGGDPTTFIMMEYNKPGGLLEQVARGALADVVSTGSQTVGALGFASEAAQGRGAEAAGQLWDQIHQTLPVFGKHPFSQELVAHPVFSATSGLAALKGAGAIGHLHPGAARARVVPLAGHVDAVTGKQMVVPMGSYSKNYYKMFGQGLRDLLVSHNRHAAAYSWKKIGDLLVRQQRARVTPEHQDVQVPYRNAEQALPQERRALLMEIQDHGGEPGIRDAVDHFHAMQEAGLDVPEERLHLDETLLTVLHNLTPADHAWLEAHARIAEHTSTERQMRGEHGAISQLYRKYETPIEMGASREAREGVVGPFTRAKAARDEFLHLNDTGGPSDAWLAKDAEISRDIKGHAKRAATKAAKAIKDYQAAISAYREAYKPWKAKQDEIKARQPEKPEPKLRTKKVDENTRTTNVASRNEAIALIAPVRAKHPDWKIEVTKKADDSWDVTVTRPEPKAPEGPTVAELKAQADADQARADAAFKAFMENPSSGRKGHATRTTRIAEESGAEHERAQADIDLTKSVAERKTQVAADHKAWRQELKEHNATKPARPERPVGLERGAGRLAVHEGEVTRQSARQERLRAAQEARQPPPEDQIRQEYADAVAAAVGAHHERPGAIEPAYVSRTAPPLDKRGKFRRGRNLTSNLNIPKGHASSGATVRSGRYVYDTSVPLRENFNEQLTRMKTGLYNGIVNNPLVHDVTGGGPKQAKRLEADGASEAEIEAARAPTVVPEGMVAVPIHYPGSRAQVTEPLWARETPLAAHEHFDPNVRQALHKRAWERLRGETLQPAEQIPDGQRVLLVPQGLHERLDEYAHPNDADPSAYDNFIRGYQKLLIGIYPSTWLGNAPGSIPLAIASGAISGRDYYRAFKTGPQGPVTRRLGIERTNESNAAIQNLGASAKLGDILPGGNPIMGAAEKGRGFSIAGENFAARAAWEGRARVAVDGRIPTLRKIVPGLEKLIPESMQGEAARMSVDSATLHTWLKRNKMELEDGKLVELPPHLQEVHDRLVQDVVDFMSEGGKPNGKLSRVAGKAILFQNWMGHILKLTVFTMPVRYPGRAVLYNAMSAYGNQYRREHGVYPSWMGQFFPILRQGDYVLSGGLGQLTPLASAQNLAQAGSNVTDTSNPSNSWLRQINNQINPILQPVGSALLQQYDNSKLHPNEIASKYRSPLHVFTAGAYFAIPGAHKFQPLSGYEPGSAGLMGIPLPGPVFGGLKKKDYFVYFNNGDGTTTKVPIKWENRPGGHPVEGVGGAVSRYLGVPLERSAVAGPSWQAQLTNSSTFPYIDWYKALFAQPGAP